MLTQFTVEICVLASNRQKNQQSLLLISKLFKAICWYPEKLDNSACYACITLPNVMHMHSLTKRPSHLFDNNVYDVKPFIGAKLAKVILNWCRN